MSKARSTPSLSAAISGVINAKLAEEFFVSLPGRVEVYDAGEQRAHVQPLLRRGYVDEFGKRQAEDYPVVPEVPVVFPGSGAYSITWPIRAGDTGLLIFASGSLDLWLTRGGVVDPGDDRRQALSDAVFVPGLRPFSKPVGGGGVSGDSLVIGANRVDLGASGLAPTDELVHGTGIDPFTGATYKALANTASSVRARK